MAITLNGTLPFLPGARRAERPGHPAPLPGTGGDEGVRRRDLLAALAACLLASPAGAQAPDPVIEELQTVARALGFLDRPPVGTVALGVAYDGASAEERAEAEALVRRVGDRLAAGAVVLRPGAVAIEQLDRAPPPVLLIPEGTARLAPDIATRLEGRGVLTVSRLAEPVLAGHIVMAVAARPRVEILVSREAARRAGIRFVSAFRMLIQER